MASLGNITLFLRGPLDAEGMLSVLPPSLLGMASFGSITLFLRGLETTGEASGFPPSLLPLGALDDETTSDLICCHRFEDSLPFEAPGVGFSTGAGVREAVDKYKVTVK